MPPKESYVDKINPGYNADDNGFWKLDTVKLIEVPPVILFGIAFHIVRISFTNEAFKFVEISPYPAVTLNGFQSIDKTPVEA